MNTFAADGLHDDRPSPFAGDDVCLRAGVALPDGTRHLLFDDDLWDFTEVIGLAVHIPLANRRFNFALIDDPRWRLVAKELTMALLAPRHPAVAELPRAYRTPLHLRSCIGRLNELTRLFRWLEQRHVATLADIDTHACEAYLAFRRNVLDEDGAVVGEQGPSVRRAAAQIIVDLVNYRDLFTADRVRPGLRPWGGASASAVAEMRSGRDGNTTPAVADEILQPMLAAALHLVQVLGPHAVALNEQIREHDRVHSTRKGLLPAVKGHGNNVTTLGSHVTSRLLTSPPEDCPSPPRCRSQCRIPTPARLRCRPHMTILNTITRLPGSQSH